MPKIRVMIVDDEELARAVIKEMLEAHADIEVAAECANGFETVKAFEECKPDLIYLDVQMPKLDGFEVLELIGPGVPVIFVTAYDAYAMKAFEVHAVDYLLKPFSAERFEAALDRARQRLSQSIKMPMPAELSAAARAPAQYIDRIVIKDGARVHIVAVSQVDYLEAQDDYVAVHSLGKKYLKQQTISSLEEALDPNRFVRIHRSYIVNLEKIAKIEPYTKDSRLAILQDGAKLPVSQNGYARLTRLLS
jgi:two-component system, LytTR family, response regulator